MSELFTSGSVGGMGGNPRPYPEFCGFTNLGRGVVGAFRVGRPRLPKAKRRAQRGVQRKAAVTRCASFCLAKTIAARL